MRRRTHASSLPRLRGPARLAAAGLALAGATAAAQPAPGAAPPDSLARAVARLDSTLFAAYNGCDLATLGALASEDLEFYHDQTGLARGRTALVDAVRQNVCGKVRRDPVPGTLAVYPLRGYGTVATGEHRFCDPRAYRACPAAAGGVAKFVMLWRREAAGGWQLTRVVSYDHAPRTDSGAVDAARAEPRPAAAPTRSPTPHAAALADSLDARASSWLAQSRVPSLAVAYVADGAVQWTRAYGEQAPGVSATPRTLYNVASLTKPVFAEVVVRLAAAGRLALDEPMAPTWVDPDVAGDPRHRALTPRLALSHRTGFPNWRHQTGGVLRFRAEPGTAYGYSGEGYEYAARFVERRLGAPLDTLARAYVFGPFGMSDAAFTARSEFAGRVARPLGPNRQWGEPEFSPRGNAADLLYATAGDYGAFLAGVMNRAGLPADLARQRDSAHVPDPGARASCPARVGRCPAVYGYGLGWQVFRYAAARGQAAETVLWHTGSDWGNRAAVLYIPERRVGAVLLTNGAGGLRPIVDAGLLLFGDTAFADYLREGARQVRAAR